MRQIIKTNKAPAAIGPYNQGVKVNGTMVFTAGQIPLDPETGEIVGNDIANQTHQSLKNVRAVLEASGSSLANVIKVTVFLKNIEDFHAMNEIYSQYFNDSPPARSAVEVSRLPKDVLVEIEAVALV